MSSTHFWDKSDPLLTDGKVHCNRKSTSKCSFWSSRYLSEIFPCLQRKLYKSLNPLMQVCQCLMSGQVKSVKPYLKQLQQSIQTITQPNLMPSDEGKIN